MTRGRGGGTIPPKNDDVINEQPLMNYLGRTLNTNLRILSGRGYSPLCRQNFRKKSYGCGGYPPSPLYRHSPKKCSSKRTKNCVLCPKNTCFFVKKSYGFGGQPPSPLYGRDFWQRQSYRQNPQSCIWCTPLGKRSNTTLQILSVRGVSPPLTDKILAKIQYTICLTFIKLLLNTPQTKS